MDFENDRRLDTIAIEEAELILFKKCKRCQKDKPITEFYRKEFSRSKDRFDYWCKDCTRKYSKKYYKENSIKINKKRVVYLKEYYKRNPWANTYKSIISRCSGYGNKGQYYFKKGIKNFLTLEDLKFLWFRDRAFELSEPTIDRKNNSGHYTLENCRYIEMSENRIGRDNVKKRR